MRNASGGIPAGVCVSQLGPSTSVLTSLEERNAEWCWSARKNTELELRIAIWGGSQRSLLLPGLMWAQTPEEMAGEA